MQNRSLTIWLAAIAIGIMVIVGIFAYRMSTNSGTKVKAVQNALSCTQRLERCRETSRLASTPIRGVTGATIHWMGHLVEPGLSTRLIPTDLPASSLVIDILGHAARVDRAQLFAWLNTLKSTAFKGMPPRVWVKYRGSPNSVQAYADLLHHLRGLLGREAQISSTIDPLWINHPGFEAVQAEVNDWLLFAEDWNEESVGIVNADAVLKDMRNVSRAGFGLPFSVVLPTEGIVLYRDGGDRLIGTSETPPEADLNPLGGMRRLSAVPNPIQIEDLLLRSKAYSFRNLNGFIWERGSDRPSNLALTDRTLARLTSGNLLPTDLTLHYHADRDQQITELWVSNSSDVTLPLPKNLLVDELCKTVSTFEGYSIPKAKSVEAISIRMSRVALIGPNEKKLVMTANCLKTPIDAHVQLETNRTQP